MNINQFNYSIPSAIESFIKSFIESFMNKLFQDFLPLELFPTWFNCVPTLPLIWLPTRWWWLILALVTLLPLLFMLLLYWLWWCWSLSALEVVLHRLVRTWLWWWLMALCGIEWWLLLVWLWLWVWDVGFRVGTSLGRGIRIGWMSSQASILNVIVCWRINEWVNEWMVNTINQSIIELTME